VCLLCLRDLPTLIFIPAFYLTEENKSGSNKASTSSNTEEPKLFIIVFYYFYYFILFYLFIQLLSFYHNLSNVKIMFAKINLALIHLRHKLLLLFLKLTQSSLTKIQHQVKF
jgi:hypothetical protein